MTRTPRPPTRRALLAGLGALAAAPTLSAANGSWPEPWRWRGRVATLEVVGRDSGSVHPVYWKDGRAWVAGRPGARYALRVRNLAPRRVLMVVSVDGVNVVSGQTAAVHQTGYVLEPGRAHDITGWRKSDTEVAAFEFAPLRDSYAARTGRPGHVGVIGLAAFVEREAPPPPPPALLQAPQTPRARADGAPAPAAVGAGADSANRMAEAAPQRLGTGHGEREWSAVGHTQFERASDTPTQLVQIGYDSHERLVAAGIIAAPDGGGWRDRPSPFPAGPAAYVPDPPRRW